MLQLAYTCCLGVDSRRIRVLRVLEVVVVRKSERMECAFAISLNRCLRVVVEKFGRMMLHLHFQMGKLENFRGLVSLRFLVLKGEGCLTFSLCKVSSQSWKGVRVAILLKTTYQRPLNMVFLKFACKTLNRS